MKKKDFFKARLTGRGHSCGIFRKRFQGLLSTIHSSYSLLSNGFLWKTGLLMSCSELFSISKIRFAKHFLTLHVLYNKVLVHFHSFMFYRFPSLTWVKSLPFPLLCMAVVCRDQSQLCLLGWYNGGKYFLDSLLCPGLDDRGAIVLSLKVPSAIKLTFFKLTINI